MRSNCRHVRGLVTLAALGMIGAVLEGLPMDARAQEAFSEETREAEGAALPEASDVEMYGVETEEELPREAEGTTEPGEMIEAPERERYRVIVRPSLWVPWSTSKFRNGSSGTTFSLEGDKKTEDFGVFPMQFILPIEATIRTKNQEFRLRYLWWTRESDAQSGSSLVFGSAPFGVAESVTASLNTHALGFDLLHRILAKDRFDLYLAAGGDLFYTSLKLSSSIRSDKLEEMPLILSVGLGLRFNVRPDLSVFFVHRALSFAQILFIQEEFFGGRDVYRDLEIALMWEKSEKVDLGVGWRHYEVSFESSRLEASQVMSGASCWVRYKF